MLYRFLADLVVCLHLGFIVFAVLGGFLVLRWRWLIWLHLPAAIWGALVEFAGWYCPLTSLENRFLRASGEAGYDGGFVEVYILPVIYPPGLTHSIQIGIGTGVILINLIAYGLVWRRHLRKWRVHRGSAS